MFTGGCQRAQTGGIFLKSEWRADTFRPFGAHEWMLGGCSVPANEQKGEYLPPTGGTAALFF